MRYLCLVYYEEKRLDEAKDLNDAIRVASRIPPARLGCIEVRPILELTQL